MPKAVRVLADRSKDTCGGGAFRGLLPRSEFQCTDNRGILSAELLAQYDLLSICGQSKRGYSGVELEAIRGFVQEGGSLVLAADASTFELEANRSVETMAQNAVAGLFGGAFLSADADGAKADASLRVRIPRQAIRITRHPMLAEAGGGLAGHGCGPISPPSNATVLGWHAKTRHPVAALASAGRGSVLMVGASEFADWHGLTCRHLAQWLGTQRKKRPKYDTGLPPYIGKREGSRKDDPFRVAYDPACSRLAKDTLSLLGRIKLVLTKRFGDSNRFKQLCAVRDTLRGAYHWEFAVGGQAPPPSRARHAVNSMLCRCLRWELRECLGAVFSDRAWRIHFLLDVLCDIGFENEAQRCRERAERWISEMDSRAKHFDLARCYHATEEQCPRGLVLIREIRGTHGDKLLEKFARTLSGKDYRKHLPDSYAWTSDVAIYYLSLAAGSDLFAWFEARGMTVHAVPIVKLCAKGAKERMIARLREALRDGAEALSSRVDAATDLVTMGKRKDWGGDDWGALCAALKCSREGDVRAVKRLRALFEESKPAPLRAVAGVALADLGIAAVAEDLIALACSFDPRFQLMAWYALARAGSPKADELSLERICSADGKRTGSLDVRTYDCIAMHGKVDGHKTNNILSNAAIHPFTDHAAITVHEVWWVHTSPVWRRRGLARHTMQRTMDHPLARKCSCSELGTGTRNVAHSLYRSFGFTDMAVGHRWMCELPGNTVLAPPVGVTLREYASGDWTTLVDLCRDVRGMALSPGAPGGELSACDVAFVAERKGKPVGFARAEYQVGDEARMRQLVIKEDDQRANIADALIALVHRAIRKAGAKRVGWHDPHEDDYVREALSRAAYVPKKSRGVWCMQIRHLPQFLREIAPVFEKRLSASDAREWQGTIDLVGRRLRGRLTINKAKVKSGAPTRRPADIVLSADDDTITRVALGRETPFEAYLQTRLVIEPRISASITKLVEVVFPRVLL